MSPFGGIFCCLERMTPRVGARRRFARAGLALACGLVAVVSLVVAPILNRVAWTVSRIGDSTGVVRQVDRSDCGPAALKMILDHYGVKSSVEELRAQAGTKDTGTTLLALKETAEGKGLKSAGWRMSLEDLSRLEMPVIALVRGDHFVVVRSIGEEIVVDDPSLGRLRMSERVFRSAWNGVVLSFWAAHLGDTGGAL